MPDAQPLQPGDPDAIGAYRLVGRLGEGGQGVVYLGEGADGRRVAVKLLQAHLDDTARGRFVRELASTKRVARFCTAQVLDADLDGDRPFIVSEYVDGPSLSEAVAAEGVLADGALERLATGTLTALAAIHQAGVVHRDFKPGNVLLGPDGPRVIDFGIAKALDGAAMATQPSAVIGTPAYMSPEQVKGEAVGRPADVWAWAATLVFAATGVPPFGLDGITTVIGRILHADPNLGSMSGPLRDLVQAALAKEPGARPTAQELLLRLLGGPEPSAAVVQAPATALLELGEDRAVPVPPTVPLSSERSGNTPAGVPFSTVSARSRRGSRPGFRPGVAVASAVVAALLVGGGTLLAAKMLDEDGPARRSPGLVLDDSESRDPLNTAPKPSPDSSKPQKTATRQPSATSSPPPAQTAGTLKCFETEPHALGPEESSSGLSFSAIGGPVTWRASSGSGSVSLAGGELPAGQRTRVGLTLSAEERAAGGASTITVTDASGASSCTRSVSWEPRVVTQPTETIPPEPTPTTTPDAPDETAP
ncbi:serine/threonine-protein kinase [Actinocorallia aurantiaca]|uniref:Protein kinase domain-containing protein n=1 Tax=Actinocorallia aurantiaca TaxID=46204 RepID=A0ABP6GUW2_9ACTN